MWTYFYKEVIGLFAIVEPFGVIPLFLVATDSWEFSARKKMAWFASLTAGAVLIMVALLGIQWLDFFGVSLPSFMVGGGILLLLIAIDMLLGTKSKLKQAPRETKPSQEESHSSMAVFPFAIPLLAGPAAISHVVIQSAPSSPIPLWVVMVAIGVVTLLVGLILSSASFIHRWIGEVGMNVITRLMGLMLAAIAIETISRGVLRLFPGLG